MRIKLNPTGTHTHKGYLKVRVDLYPEPTDKTYAIHYVDEVDEEGNPTGRKQLNPCLCHFIKIDPNITLAGLTQLVRGMFDRQTLTLLDDVLSRRDIGQLREIMKTRLGEGKQVGVVDIAKLNERLAGMEVIV